MSKLISLRQNELINYKYEYSQQLQDDVYDLLNDYKQQMYKGQKKDLYRTIEFTKDKARFSFVIDIKAELKKSFTYYGSIQASVTFPNGCKKSDTIILRQDEIIQKESVFKKIWSWIKSFF
ncbi:hypothetical protein ABPG74_002159 [Tetrahymena malaccensis]